MAKVYLDIKGRFQSAFGLFRPAGIVKEGNYPLELFQYSQDDPEYTVFRYNGIELTFAGMLLSHADAIYAPPLMLDFSRNKKLIETEVNESSDVVIEHWGNEAYEINIRGIVIDMREHQYPADLVTRLHNLFEWNGIIEVTGRQFIDKDITSIYFKTYEVKPVEGYEDTVQFSIKASSIKPVTFSLINPV